MIGLLAGLVSAPAWAGDDRQKAARLLDEGNQLFDQKRYGEALHRFEAAYAAFASPKILLNLAEAHRELGALDRAAAQYEHFLQAADQGENAKFQEYRELAQQRLEALSKRLGRVELLGPHDEVRIGEALLTEIREGQFWIMPGSHRLTVSRSGAEPFVTTLEVKAGETLRVSVQYPSEAIAKTDPPPPPERQTALAADETPAIDAQPEPFRLLEPTPSAQTEAPITTQWWFWAAIGAAVATAVVVVAVASSGGDEYVPNGELGRESTAAGWQPFTVGGLR